VDLRDLEQIQEEPPRARSLPFGALLLAAICGGALVVVVMGTFQREAPAPAANKDPLAALLERQEPSAPAGRVDEDDVTFPEILSDGTKPTTALAAVKDERGRLLEAERTEPGAAAPPVDLPQGQLPAGDLLHSTPVTSAPKDDLSQLAASRLSGERDTMAPPGSQGGYEIQVASFPEAGPADAFVDELRKRGHSAYRQAAYVHERGLWHRVRIGSFKAKYEALAYQKKLEQTERLSTFLVDPEKVKRQEAIRAAKQEARDRKLERLKKRSKE
jgi:cell division septation protein DedD